MFCIFYLSYTSGKIFRCFNLVEKAMSKSQEENRVYFGSGAQRGQLEDYSRTVALGLQILKAGLEEWPQECVSSICISIFISLFLLSLFETASQSMAIS